MTEFRKNEEESAASDRAKSLEASDASEKENSLKEIVASEKENSLEEVADSKEKHFLVENADGNEMNMLQEEKDDDLPKRYCPNCGMLIYDDWVQCLYCEYEFPVKAKTYVGKFAVFFIILLLCLFLFSGGLDRLKVHFLGVGEITTTQGELIENNALETEQDEIYRTIHDALSNVDEQFIFGNQAIETLTPDGELNEALLLDYFHRVLNENPDAMFLEGYTYSSDGTVHLNYNVPVAEIKGIMKATDEKAEQVLAEIIHEDMSEFDKELAIHDYIVDNCEYDIENYNNKTFSQNISTAYGVLIERKAICGGYANAMKLLMNKAGLQCIIVRGESKGEGHAWNMVQIDGANYQLDPTWNDPVSENGMKDISSHMYFNLSDKDLGYDHTWDREKYPSCDSTEHNYYYYTQAAAADFDSFINMIIEQCKAGDSLIEARIIKPEDSEMTVEAAAKKAINSAFLTGRFQYSYNFNEETGIAVINF